MEHLTDDQVVFVETYLKNIGISDEALLNQLTDHLSVLIEIEMQGGKDFTTAFKEVSKSYTSKTTDVIQSEIAINKYYPKYLTKPVIISIGIITFSILIIGLYLRFYHLPFRKLFQFIGAIGFGYVFIPIYFLHQLMMDANKVKSVAQFITAFMVFHSAFAFALNWRISKFLIPSSIFIISVYALVFLINPSIKKGIKKLFLSISLFATLYVSAQKNQVSNYKIVTSDVANFIHIFNTVDSANRITTFQSDYLDKGSDGLKDYASLRFDSAAGLVERVYGSPIFYKKLIVTLSNTDFDALSKQVVIPINKFISIYDRAVIPNIYLLVGGIGNGSTPGKTGLLLGLDSYLLCFKDRSKFVGLDAIIAHELIHFNQSYLKNESLIENNLLAQVIKEGSADFLGELLSGSVEHCNLDMYQWGEKHIQQLWTEFKQDIKDSTKISKWLYNDQPDRPRSLGYFMGYKITKAYYYKATNKKQAIKEILNIHQDKFYQFLEKSGYDGE